MNQNISRFLFVHRDTAGQERFRVITTTVDDNIDLSH